jgi:hypothetical protein
MSTELPISVSTRRMAPVTATAGQRQFSFSFPVIRETDLRVFRTRADVRAALAYGTEFTVWGAGEADGGTVTLAAGALAGDVIVIEGDAALDRLTGVTQAGRFSSKLIDREFDLGLIRDQELRRDVDDLGQMDIALAVTSTINAAANANAAATGAAASASAAAASASTLTVTSGFYPTVAAAAAATVAATVSIIQVSGFSAAGDGGSAQYKREAAQPAHAARFRTQDRFLPNGTVSAANGGWWGMAETAVNQYQFGAKDGFAADDWAAFQNMADYCSQAGAAILAAPGRHLVSAPIVWKPKPIPDWDYNFYKRGPSWRFDNNMIVRATASMAAIFQFGAHTYETIIRQGYISGGVFDCNNLAQRGVWVTFLNKAIVEQVKVLNMPANGCGIQFGTTTLNEFGGLDVGYEGFAHDCMIQGQLGIAARAGTAGVRYVNCSDNHTRGNVICDVLTGVSADNASGWDGKHIANHMWSHAEVGPMSYGFDLYGDNVLMGNQMDGPFAYVARFQGPRNNVVGARVNYGGNSADADVFAALFRLEAAGEVMVTNSGFKGTASKRIATEVSLGPGVPASAYKKDGSSFYLNVNSQAPVNIGAHAKDRCAIASAAISSQTSRFGTFSRATPGGRIQFTYTMTNAPSDFVYSVVVGRQTGNFPAFVNHVSQSSNAVTFEVQNTSGVTVDPDFIGIRVEAL